MLRQKHPFVKSEALVPLHGILGIFIGFFIVLMMQNGDIWRLYQKSS